MMSRVGLASILVAGLVVPAAFAGETVTEHESYEKRSMKVETVPPPPAPRVEEHTTYDESTRRETERRPADVQVEKRTTIEPGKVIKEKKTETVETNDD